MKTVKIDVRVPVPFMEWATEVATTVNSTVSEVFRQSVLLAMMNEDIIVNTMGTVPQVTEYLKQRIAEEGQNG